ncbi:MAG: hypothetical protein O3A63_09645, partial [Proteobacteria bacterium]|nr:hypothetical protein [Pseudomonadota bacterium]
DLLARIVRRILDELTRDLPAPVAPAEYQHQSADLQAFAGEYYPTSARFGIDRWRKGQARRLLIKVNDDGRRLLIGSRGGDQQLIATGRGQFRRLTDPLTTFVFARDPAGHLYLQGEFGNYVNLLTCPAFIGWCNSQ